MRNDLVEPPTPEELKNMSQEEFNELVRKRVEQDENDPFYEPPSRAKFIGCLSVGVLAAAALVWLLLRMFGMFTMGIPGVVSSYLVGLLFAAVIALLARPVSKDIREIEHPVKRVLSGCLAIGIAVALVWVFVVNPLLDIPHLMAPSVIELTNVRVDWEDSGYYQLEGDDAEGRPCVFTIDRSFYDAWNRDDRDATVTYLPHSRTVLSVDVP